MADRDPAAPRNGNRYKDWICLLCHNHNYSFRTECNRCHLMTKDQNLYLEHYQQFGLQQTYAAQLTSAEQKLRRQGQIFPQVVLLMVNEQPWEGQNWRDTCEPAPSKWITNLIED